MTKSGAQLFEAVPTVEHRAISEYALSNSPREDALEEDSIPVAQSFPSFTEGDGTTGLTRASSIPVSLKIYCDVSSLVALSFMLTCVTICIHSRSLNCRQWLK